MFSTSFAEKSFLNSMETLKKIIITLSDWVTWEGFKKKNRLFTCQNVHHSGWYGNMLPFFRKCKSTKKKYLLTEHWMNTYFQSSYSEFTAMRKWNTVYCIPLLFCYYRWKQDTTKDEKKGWHMFIIIRKWATTTCRKMSKLPKPGEKEIGKTRLKSTKHTWLGPPKEWEASLVKVQQECKAHNRKKLY